MSTSVRLGRLEPPTRNPHTSNSFYASFGSHTCSTKGHVQRWNRPRIWMMGWGWIPYSLSVLIPTTSAMSEYKDWLVSTLQCKDFNECLHVWETKRVLWFIVSRFCNNWSWACQTKAGIWELNPDLSCWWQGSKYLSLLPFTVCIKKKMNSRAKLGLPSR